MVMALEMMMNDGWCRYNNDGEEEIDGDRVPSDEYAMMVIGYDNDNEEKEDSDGIIYNEY